MPRLNYIKPEDAQGEIKDIYKDLKSEYGQVFNLFQGLANSPTALKAYLKLNELISEGKLNEREAEITRLAASWENDCSYCKAAHYNGLKKTGMDENEIQDLLNGESDNKKYSTLWWFTRKVMDTRGFVDSGDIEKFKNAGYDDEYIPEVITVIAQKTLSNYFNHIHDTEVDMPEIPEMEMQEA